MLNQQEIRGEISPAREQGADKKNRSFNPRQKAMRRWGVEIGVPWKVYLQNLQKSN